MCVCVCVCNGISIYPYYIACRGVHYIQLALFVCMCGCLCVHMLLGACVFGCGMTFRTLPLYLHVAARVSFSARVVNISSLVSVMSLEKCAAELADKLKSLSTIQELSSYMRKFIE